MCMNQSIFCIYSSLHIGTTNTKSFIMYPVSISLTYSLNVFRPSYVRSIVVSHIGGDRNEVV